MNSDTLVPSHSIQDFKVGVDNLLQKRDYFIQKILPKLEEGRDYYVIKGKKSLGKAGAEKLAAIYSLVATFAKDTDTIESFQSVEGLVAYVCSLTRSGDVVGQGRGAAVLKANGNDANKTLKMAQKSAFIDGVIRCTGLSDIFTQDLESMPIQTISKIPGPEGFPHIHDDLEGLDRPAFHGEDDLLKKMTSKQEVLLRQLITEKLHSPSSREEYLRQINPHLSRFQCSELISSLLPMK